MRDIDPARPLRALPATPPDPRSAAVLPPPRSGVAPADESPLRDIVAALRRRALVIVIAAVALPAGALAYSLDAEDQYTATAKLLFRDPGFDQKLLGGPVLAPSVDPAREAATNIGLVSLDTVSTRAARSKAIRARALTPSEIRDKVTVAAQGQSNVVAVTAVDRDPQFAARLANTISRQYIVFRRDADRGKITQALRLVQRQLRALSPAQREATQGRSLRQQVDQLRVLAALQTGNAELVQHAEPPLTASSPKPLRNTIIALILGLMAGIGLALLLDRLDRRLRDRDDAERLLGRPVVGAIPTAGSLRSGQRDALHLEGEEAEAFRALRANLRYYDIDRDIRSLLVTSSAPGDGKSTVARYLAATAAAAGVRTILVEADLRRPTLNALFPKLRPAGLSDVLSDQSPLAGAIGQLPVSMAGAKSGRTLDVMVAGTPPPNPTDLLESGRMRAVLADLEQRYELVVVDSSPVTVVPDSIPVLNQVSGVLVVMRESRSTSVDVRRLRDQLEHLGIAPLGIVMNGTAPIEKDAYRGYYAYTQADGDSAGGAARSTPWGARARRRRIRKQREPAASRQ